MSSVSPLEFLIVPEASSMQSVGLLPCNHNLIWQHLCFTQTPPLLAVQVVGTFISALVFGFATYLLVLLKVVNITSMAGAPLVECLMYGEHLGRLLGGRHVFGCGISRGLWLQASSLACGVGFLHQFCAVIFSSM